MVCVRSGQSQEMHSLVEDECDEMTFFLFKALELRIARGFSLIMTVYTTLQHCHYNL